MKPWKHFILPLLYYQSKSLKKYNNANLKWIHTNDRRNKQLMCSWVTGNVCKIILSCVKWKTSVSLPTGKIWDNWPFFLQPFYKGVSTFRQLLIKVEMLPQNYTLVNSSQSRKRTLLAFLCLLIAMPLGTLTAVIVRSRAAFTPEYMHCFIGLLWVNDEVINVLVWFFFRLF